MKARTLLNIGDGRTAAAARWGEWRFLLGRDRTRHVSTTTYNPAYGSDDISIYSTALASRSLLTAGRLIAKVGKIASVDVARLSAIVTIPVAALDRGLTASEIRDFEAKLLHKPQGEQTFRLQALKNYGKDAKTAKGLWDGHDCQNVSTWIW